MGKEVDRGEAYSGRRELGGRGGLECDLWLLCKLPIEVEHWTLAAKNCCCRSRVYQRTCCRCHYVAVSASASVIVTIIVAVAVTVAGYITVAVTVTVAATASVVAAGTVIVAVVAEVSAAVSVAVAIFVAVTYGLRMTPKNTP